MKMTLKILILQEGEHCGIISDVFAAAVSRLCQLCVFHIFIVDQTGTQNVNLCPSIFKVLKGINVYHLFIPPSLSPFHCLSLSLSLSACICMCMMSAKIKQKIYRSGPNFQRWWAFYEEENHSS